MATKNSRPSQKLKRASESEFGSLCKVLHTLILQRQQLINGDIIKPFTDDRAILLLSRPVQMLDDGALVLEFFGLFWVCGSDLGNTGFFEMASAAIQYARFFEAEPESIVHDSAGQEREAGMEGHQRDSWQHSD